MEFYSNLLVFFNAMGYLHLFSIHFMMFRKARPAFSFQFISVIFMNTVYLTLSRAGTAGARRNRDNSHGIE